MSGNKTKYVLDANTFIEAKNRYYGFEICPGFWTALISTHRSGEVVSIDRILDELKSQKDRLSDWVEKEVPKSFFKKTQDKTVIDTYRDMLVWVNSEGFSQEAKAEFANVADGWVIAYAKSNGLTVVSHEEFAPDAKRRVPMPNVCLEFNVPYCNTFEMLTELRVRFVLSTKRRRNRGT